MKTTLSTVGSNRGGSALIETLPPTISTSFRQILLHDPKPGRASHLADKAREKFPEISIGSTTNTSRTAITTLTAGDTLAYTADSVSALYRTLEYREQHQKSIHMTAQIIGQTPTGSRMGILSCLRAEDPDAGTHLSLWRVLGSMGPESSSRDMSALTTRVFRPFRRTLSRGHSTALQELAYDSADRSIASLNITFGAQIYPMIPTFFESTPRWRDQKSLALDLVSQHPSGHHTRFGDDGQIIAALISPSILHLHTISVNRRGKYRHEGLHEISPQSTRLDIAQVRFTD